MTPTRHCRLCAQEDTDRMVACDDCDQWFHYECVGTDDSVENQPWSCTRCLDAAKSSERQSSNVSKIAEQQTQTEEVNLTSIQLTNYFPQFQQQKQSTDNLAKVKSQDEVQRKLQLLEEQYLQQKQQLMNAMNADEHKNINNYSTFASPPIKMTLLPEQIAARNGITKDLPIFNGKPEEWPLFITSFNMSTTACGFSHVENLIRLQRCLKGRALESVRSLLLLPANVPDVIDTLKILYGRPEQIINNLVQQIRQEPNPRTDKLNSLIAFAVMVRNLCSTIQASDLEEHMNNPMLRQELVDKLPPQCKIEWAMYSSKLKKVNLLIFSEWLYDIAKAISTVTIEKVEEKYTRTKPKAGATIHVHEEVTMYKEGEHLCKICNVKRHNVENCPKFQSSTLNEKWFLVKKYNLCKGCLRCHSFSKCKEKKECRVSGCSARHHFLLHNQNWKIPQECFNKTQPILPPNSYQENPSPSVVITHHTAGNKQESAVLLRVIPVTLYGPNKRIQTYALLDEGSSLTLMEKEIAEQLELRGEDETLCLRWTGDLVRQEESTRVSCRISQSKSDAHKYELNGVRTVKKLSLPEQSMNFLELKERYKYLHNVPIESYEKAKPSILIGIDNWKLGIPLRVIEKGWTDPVATRTRLGWVLSGGGANSTANILFHSYKECECEKSLQSSLKQYLELSEGDMKEHSIMTTEEKRAVCLLNETVKRIHGRYESGLLWRCETVDLPESYNMALKRLTCLEKKIQKEPGLHDVMKRHINNLLEKDYARKLTKAELDEFHERQWYLPIFVVQNPNKPNKIRLVWDAAAAVEGISLNTMLLSGPDQLVPLIHVLYQFRERKIAVTGDIKEMFHQVRVNNKDQQVQRFLWRDCDTTRPPDVYVMQVLTFGASCSPCIAQFVKNINAKNFISQYPEAVNIITNNHYVDDFLFSVDTCEQAIELIKQIKFIHENAGFVIHQWNSNDQRVLQATDVIADKGKDLISIRENETEKILGLWWDTERDVFTFVRKYSKINPEIIHGNKAPTKRELLKLLMSIYDPLGFLAHYLIGLKIILQEVQRLKTEWDDVIPDHTLKKWWKWLSYLSQIEGVSVPRCYATFLNHQSTSIDLHVMVDASQEAMAAVAYFRAVNGNKIEVVFVGAKTKVAPQQVTSIPRLELQAAVLGVRLANSVAQGHTINIRRRTFWSDSKTVLSWIKSEIRRYKPYVMYRVSEILETSKPKEWKWVHTKSNVADLATKIQNPPVFDIAGSWFAGPKYLWLNEEKWPTSPDDTFYDTKEELRPKFCLAHTRELMNHQIDVQRFSNWSRLLRSIAWIYRYLHNLAAKRNKQRVQTGPLTTGELRKSHNKLVQIAQSDEYEDEILLLRRNKRIPKTSHIYNLSPYLDDNNILRVKGRIDHACAANDDVKRPIILPRRHHITHLLLQSYHTKFHHCYHEVALNEVKQIYWVSHLRAEMRSIRNRCNQCHITNAKPSFPEMAPLPPARVAAYTPPFTFVGVDYFGPMLVTVGRRTEKRWGVLFTCLTVRAVHVEVAHSLSSDSCIIAVRNFMARRGTPKIFYSDNGTNFKGAERELQEAYSKMDKNAFAENITTIDTEWRFIPPAAPHMGGSWERLVGSIKCVLRQICHGRKFNDENLRCFLAEAENVVNSRPLTHVAVEPGELEALTPNHFLIGSSNGSKQPGEFDIKDTYLRKNWRYAQQMANTFWRRWLLEYLPTLTRRSKWFTPSTPLKPGDVVIIIDENLPRNSWPKGRIISVTKAEDGQVRRALIKTTTGIYERPAVKLAVLDVQKDEKGEQATSSDCSRSPLGVSSVNGDISKTAARIQQPESSSPKEGRRRQEEETYSEK